MIDKKLNDTVLYNVIGMDDLEGMTFAQCTSLEKAKKAKALLEKEGFADMIDIVPSEILIDTLEVNGKLIEL